MIFTYLCIYSFRVHQSIILLLFSGPFYHSTAILGTILSFYCYSRDQSIILLLFSGPFYHSTAILGTKLSFYCYSRDQFILLLLFSGPIYHSTAILGTNLSFYCYSRDQSIIVLLFSDVVATMTWTRASKGADAHRPLLMLSWHHQPDILSHQVAGMTRGKRVDVFLVRHQCWGVVRVSLGAYRHL